MAQNSHEKTLDGISEVHRCMGYQHKQRILKMTRNKKIALAVIATLAAGTTAAFAFGSGGHHRMGMGMHHGMGGHGMGMGMRKGKMMFKKLDADKDGVITRAEAQAARDARFAKMDADGDGDGTVTVAEIDKIIEKRLRRMQVRMRYKMLSRMDTNGDGQIGKDEFTKRPMRMFDRADANGDDKVTRQEAKRMMKRGRHFMRHMRRPGARHETWHETWQERRSRHEKRA